MKAMNNAERLIILSEGTRLIPTQGFTDITDGEATHSFTLNLVKDGTIVLSDQPVAHVEQESDAESELREALKGKNKDELKMIAEESGIEVNSRSTNSQIIDLIVAQAQENGEI